jgi:hypothetical protein
MSIIIKDNFGTFTITQTDESYSESENDKNEWDDWMELNELEYVWVNKPFEENKKIVLDEETEYLYRIIKAQKMILINQYCNEPYYDCNSLIDLKTHLYFIIKLNEELILKNTEKQFIITDEIDY